MRWHTLLLLLTLLPVVVNARAQSSTEHQEAPDTRVRGYWVDPSTRLMWAGKDNSGRDMNWRRADKYCRDLLLGGYVDWRLPTIGELEGIYDQETSTAWHVKGDILLTGYSWSASRGSDDRGRQGGASLLFNFGNGTRDLEPLGFRSFKRALCVRGDVSVDLSLPGLSRVEATRRSSSSNSADLNAKDANGRTALDLAKGIGVPGVKQAQGEGFPETVALIESLLAASAKGPTAEGSKQ
jgi:hypothetical protein